MPITIKRPAATVSEDRSHLTSEIQNQIETTTKLDTTDYTKNEETIEEIRPKTVTKKSKERTDIINLKYPEGTTQRVKTFYSSTGHNMTSGFLMSFELTVELLEKGLITFSKGGYRISQKIEQ